MDTRPKLKLTLSPFDKVLESLGKIFLVVMLGLTVYIFIKLPAVIPIHFNGSGWPDRYGKKALMLLLPVLGTIIYLALGQINKYPEVFNYTKKITNENAERQYTMSTRMIRFLKIAIVFIFTMVILFTYLTTLGVAKGLGAWFLPVVFGLMVIPTVVFIVKSLTEKNSLG